MEKKKLEFTDQELNVILFALQELPYKTVATVIQSIANQFNRINDELNKEEKKEEEKVG